jgi:hypothetical protein
MYLPRGPREDKSAYDERVKRATLYNAVRKAVNAITGMLFRIPVALGEDVPVRIRGVQAEDGKAAQEGYWADLDGCGTDGNTFFQELFRLAQRDGSSWVFVDMPPVAAARVTASPVPTAADAAALRPYAILLADEDVLEPEWGMDRGKPTLTLFRRRSVRYEAEGAFGKKAIDQVWVFRRETAAGGALTNTVTWELWERERLKPGVGGIRPEWVRVSEPKPFALPFIPAVPLYTAGSPTRPEAPPHEDLAELNVSHYQKTSDRDLFVRLCQRPVPVVTGADEHSLANDSDSQGRKEIVVGVDRPLLLSDPNAKAFWMQPDPDVLDASLEDLRALEARMAMLALSALVRTDGGAAAPETATKVRADKAENDSAASRWAVSLENVASTVLWYFAAWMKEPKGGTATISRAFEGDTLSPELLRVFYEMVEAGKASLDLLWDLMERGGLLGPWFNRELERMRLERAGLPEPTPAPTPEPEDT